MVRHRITFPMINFKAGQTNSKMERCDEQQMCSARNRIGMTWTQPSTNSLASFRSKRWIVYCRASTRRTNPAFCADSSFEAWWMTYHATRKSESLSYRVVHIRERLYKITLLPLLSLGNISQNWVSSTEVSFWRAPSTVIGRKALSPNNDKRVVQYFVNRTAASFG